MGGGSIGDCTELAMQYGSAGEGPGGTPEPLLPYGIPALGVAEDLDNVLTLLL